MHLAVGQVYKFRNKISRKYLWEMWWWWWCHKIPFSWTVGVLTNCLRICIWNGKEFNDRVEIIAFLLKDTNSFWKTPAPWGHILYTGVYMYHTIEARPLEIAVQWYPSNKGTNSLQRICSISCPSVCNTVHIQIPKEDSPEKGQNGWSQNRSLLGSSIHCIINPCKLHVLHAAAFRICKYHVSLTEQRVN